MKSQVLRILNAALGVLFVNQVLVALMSEILPRKVFKVLHGGGGMVFTVLVVLHLMLNWGWVKANFLQKSPQTKA